MDRLYYSYLNEHQTFLKSADRKILQKLISTEIDLQNISWLSRYRHFYKMNFNELEKILLATSLMRLGSDCVELDLNPEDEKWEYIFKKFSFFTGPILAGHPSRFLHLIREWGVFQILFRSSAYYYALMLEYEVLSIQHHSNLLK